MPNTWATSGVDLHLDLDPGGTRVRASLEAALRDAMRTGRLRPGTRLPSSRALAADLGIARNTVADAYGQLVAEAWLDSRHGAGTWVAERSAPPTPVAVQMRAEAGRVHYDLRPGVPDLSSFPRTPWLAAARRALAAASRDAFGYGDLRGLLELREALASYLSRARGVVVSADRIVVCSGFAHGLELMCDVLRAGGGRTIAAEAFGHTRLRRVVEARGLDATTVPVDLGGAVAEEIGAADAVLLTPAHQFPIGVPLAPERRRRVVEWASRTGHLIIEDDYDGEFRYDRQSVGALQALAPEHVVYGGTASKSLAPGLRLGWLVVPAHLTDAVVAAKHDSGSLTSSSLDQLTLAEFITSGAYDRHVRRVRIAYRRRRDRLVAALRQRVPRVRVTGISAGLHALVDLDGQPEDEVIARAAQHGLVINGLNSFAVDGRAHRSALVVGYATPPEHAFTTALARLCAVLAATEGTSVRTGQ